MSVARLGAHRDRAGADRFDGGATALEHRHKAKSIGAVDNDFETRMSGADASRVVRDCAHVGAPARHFAPVSPLAAFVG